MCLRFHIAHRDLIRPYDGEFETKTQTLMISQIKMPSSYLHSGTTGSSLLCMRAPVCRNVLGVISPLPKKWARHGFLQLAQNLH